LGPGAANSSVPLLAFAVDGSVLLALVAAVAFTTILAVVAITGIGAVR
jgi:cation/acetate symporter